MKINKVRPTKKRQRYLLFVLIIVLSSLIVIPLTFTPEYFQLMPKSSVITLLKFGNISQDDASLIKYIKEDILVPPASLTKPYNFTNTRGSVNLDHPTEFKQNLDVLQILKQINKTSNGFFIEYGAMDGAESSSTLDFERRFNWTGLLVEPNQELYEHLNNSNRKAWTANSCLSLKPYPQLLDLTKSNFYRSSESHMKIQCFPLYTFLLALKKLEVGYFKLDFQGTELRILQTIPFEKVKFLVLEVKVGGSDHDKYADKDNKGLIKSFLANNGYIFYQSIYQHYLFIHESLKANVTLPKINPEEDESSANNLKHGKRIVFGILTLLVLITFS